MGQLILGLAVFAAIVSAVLGARLIEGATRVSPPPRTWRLAAGAEEAQVEAADGVTLRGACFRPPSGPVRGAVIALHGILGSNDAMSRFAQLLTNQGYIVLAPDSRGHGGSGGELVTYGLLERKDVVCWITWLDTRFHPVAFYGYGTSLGAGILIQALDVQPAVQPKFRAIIAESPFADYRSLAYHRVWQRFPVPRPLRALIVEPAFLYARLRYGLDFNTASAEAALRRTHTPVLLIHGTADLNIPIEQARRLHAANPSTAELWEIPGGGHIGAWSATGPVFEKRVIDWFEQH